MGGRCVDGHGGDQGSQGAEEEDVLGLHARSLALPGKVCDLNCSLKPGSRCVGAARSFY